MKKHRLTDKPPNGLSEPCRNLLFEIAEELGQVPFQSRPLYQRMNFFRNIIDRAYKLGCNHVPPKKEMSEFRKQCWANLDVKNNPDAYKTDGWEAADRAFLARVDEVMKYLDKLPETQ